MDLSENICVNETFAIKTSNLVPVKRELTKCFANYLDNKFIATFVEEEKGYTALYENVEVQKNEEFIVYGYHLPGKSTPDVIRVLFKSSKLHSIPDQIFRDFENLKIHWIKRDWSLMSCRNLEIFKAAHNDIHSIDQKTFMECVNLREIELSSNKITKTFAQTFDRNINLRYINLSAHS
jgi:hypothetical protein